MELVLLVIAAVWFGSGLLAGAALLALALKERMARRPSETPGAESS